MVHPCRNDSKSVLFLPPPLSGWQLQTANAPPRQDHSGFQVGDVMYIFGGVDQNGDVSKYGRPIGTRVVWR